MRVNQDLPLALAGKALTGKDVGVQVGLTWAPDWENGQFHCAEVWVDSLSRETAAKLQRRKHIRYQRHHWLAAWVDRVEHEEAGRGVITLTLFGGMDPALYADVRAQKGFSVAAAEKTLRIWWHNHDSKGCNLLELKEIPNPPLGSSGVQLRLHCNALLEGFRPGRIVRIRPNSWPNAKLPPEERIKSLEERE